MFNRKIHYKWLIMVMFNSYVKLPEGTGGYHQLFLHRIFLQMAWENQNKPGMRKNDGHMGWSYCSALVKTSWDFGADLYLYTQYAVIQCNIIHRPSSSSSIIHYHNHHHHHSALWVTCCSAQVAWPAVWKALAFHDVCGIVSGWPNGGAICDVDDVDDDIGLLRYYNINMYIYIYTYVL